MTTQEDPSIISSIEKSKSDNFDCLIKILPNGIKALLVSDPNSENSSAALAVNIGSLSDNPDELGLAHFCEHLLFMGTEKYPSESDYEDYLSKNGGSCNAYTVRDKTVFYFEVNNSAFEGALDRFAQFFICSKFSESSVEREVNAVDSEFSKNKNTDTWRIQELFRSQLNPKSPFSQFSTGNKQTLSHPDIRQRLLKMYNKLYTSEIMTLCVYSDMKLEEQITLVEKLFKAVPKRDNFEMPRYDTVKPYDENILSHFYKIVPIKEEDKISFRWYMPFCSNYKVKPLYFFSSLFGHEGPNTITAYLKRENLITDLVTSFEDNAKIFSIFKIDITLTKKGYEDYTSVILAVLKYIQEIKIKGVCERYFNEIKNISQIKFDYRNKTQAKTFTQQYCDYLLLYKPEDVFTGKFLMKEYNEELLKKYLDMFNLDNLVISLISKKIEKECTLTEKWYGTKFSKEKLNIKQEEIEAFKYDKNKYKFDYPPENKFVPKNLDIFPIPNRENIPKYPELIFEKENCKAYFLQDNEFKLPKGIIKLRINFVKNLCNNSDIKNQIISRLLKRIIKLELNEILYLAEESDVKFKFKIFYDKIEISIQAFNDSLKSGLQEFLTYIQTMELSPEKHKEMLELQKQEYLKKINNLLLQRSYKVNIEYMKMLLLTGSNDYKDLIYFLTNEEIKLDDLIKFKKSMFLETKSLWLIQGNLQKDTALDIINTTNEIFKLDINTPITKSFYAKRTIELNPNINYTFRFLNPNKAEQDSSILSIYQMGLLEREEEQYYKILNSFLSTKFYDTLRTKETLGYIVLILKFISTEICHLVGLIQSGVKEPEYLSSRIRNFFKEKEEEIKNITEEDFNSHVKSLLVEETRKDINLKEQFKRNWDEIILNRYKFNIKEENADYLKKCTKEGFINFFEKYFKNDMRRLDIEYVCEKHWEENEKKLKEEIIDCQYIKKRLVFDKISDFQDCNNLYPCFSSSYYRDINQ